MTSPLFIVIPTSGRPCLLRRTLHSLSACKKPENYRGTIVIENGPKAGAEDIVEAFRERLRTRYVYESFGNKSHALNVILKDLRDSLIFFTDDDVRIHPETLRAYSTAAEGIQGGQFYGGPTGVDYEEEPPDWLRSYLPPSARGLNLGSNQEPVKKDLKPFLGFNWAGFANDLMDVGGFNTNLGPGSPIKSTGQEGDMHRRLYDQGAKQVYVSNAMVWHYVPKVRCSRRWIVHRVYRNGILNGLRFGKGRPTFLGYQRRMLWIWLKMLAKVLGATISLDRRASFDAIYQLSRQSGRIQGVRLSRNLYPNAVLKKGKEPYDGSSKSMLGTKRPATFQ